MRGSPFLREEVRGLAKGKYEAWLTPEGLMRLEAWARDGLTDEQIAHNMRINVKTLWDWKTKYDPICSALKKGKEVVDIQVENALFKRALGYEYEETVTETRSDGTSLTRVFKKHMPPSETAMIYWLKNRRPQAWRDRREAEANNQTLESAKELLGGVTSAIE
jgi:hypothetical protein